MRNIIKLWLFLNDSAVNTARHCTRGQCNRHIKLMSAVGQEWDDPIFNYN